jgi:hypothetical protein
MALQETPAEDLLPPDDFIDLEDVTDRFDMDSLHILPLNQLPLKTPSLKRARLVKNVRLESVIELFNDRNAGSGQIDVADLGDIFNWPTGTKHPDERLLSLLMRMKSFDIYTLRIQLREMRIDIESYDSLRLSPEKTASLTSYMKEFTQPLIMRIYGQTDTNVADMSELVGMFTTPKKEEALTNLRYMADKLNISLREVPKFLEDYGDIYLSLAYFKDCLDALIPQILSFEESMNDLMTNHQLRNDRRLTHSVMHICDRVSNVTQSVLNRFNSFDSHSKTLWENINAESFAKVKKAIQADHVAIGAVMCGLSVKMNGWQDRFGTGGSLMRRANFVMSDMMQGMDLISAIDNDDEDES